MTAILSNRRKMKKEKETKLSLPVVREWPIHLRSGLIFWWPSCFPILKMFAMWMVRTHEHWICCFANVRKTLRGILAFCCCHKIELSFFSSKILLLAHSCLWPQFYWLKMQRFICNISLQLETFSYINRTMNSSCSITRSGRINSFLVK